MKSNDDLLNEIVKLKREVLLLKQQLNELKRAILWNPTIGEQIQRKLWE
mgnify:FL=1